MFHFVSAIFENASRVWSEKAPTETHPVALRGLLRLARLEAGRKDQENETLKKIAYHDSLTGLMNRRALDKDIAERRLVKGEQVLCIDLKKFKQINDTYGHDAGDLALQAAARLMENNVRKTDRVMRAGGDEFIILLLGANRDGAAFVHDKIKKAFDELSIDYKGETIPVRGNVGGYMVEKNGMSLGDAIKEADMAMYAVKQAPALAG